MCVLCVRPGKDNAVLYIWSNAFFGQIPSCHADQPRIPQEQHSGRPMIVYIYRKIATIYTNKPRQDIGCSALSPATSLKYSQNFTYHTPFAQRAVNMRGWVAQKVQERIYTSTSSRQYDVFTHNRGVTNGHNGIGRVVRRAIPKREVDNGLPRSKLEIP